MISKIHGNAFEKQLKSRKWHLRRMDKASRSGLFFWQFASRQSYRILNFPTIHPVIDQSQYWALLSLFSFKSLSLQRCILLSPDCWVFLSLLSQILVETDGVWFPRNFRGEAKLDLDALSKKINERDFYSKRKWYGSTRRTKEVYDFTWWSLNIWEIISEKVSSHSRYLRPSWGRRE